jgi:hypothetical protein
MSGPKVLLRKFAIPCLPLLFQVNDLVFGFFRDKPSFLSDFLHPLGRHETSNRSYDSGHYRGRIRDPLGPYGLHGDPPQDENCYDLFVQN